MSLARSTRVLNRSFLRPLTASYPQYRSFAVSSRCLADYGSGEGDPKGEKPQEQGANPSADKEHPGPPPPKAGQGSGSTPTKGTSDGHNTGDAKQSGGKRSYSTLSRSAARQFSISTMSRREDRPKSTEGHQPKILNENPPNSEEESADVKKHNDDMASRADRPAAGVKNEDAQKDKVGKGFWKGQGGADREP